MDTQPLLLQVRYSAWATARVLDSVAALSGEERERNLGNSYGGVFGTLTHIFQGDSIWFDRLIGVATGSLAAYPPGADFAALSERWRALHARFVAWAEGLAPPDWDRIVSYRNTKGEPFDEPVWRIILHVVNHATYHRGQITTMLRQLGREPTGTDLIYFYHSRPAAAEV